MEPKNKAASPDKVGDLGKTASSKQVQHSRFTSKNQGDLWFIKVLVASWMVSIVLISGLIVVAEALL